METFSYLLESNWEKISKANGTQVCYLNKISHIRRYGSCTYSARTELQLKLRDPYHYRCKLLSFLLHELWYKAGRILYIHSNALHTLFLKLLKEAIYINTQEKFLKASMKIKQVIYNRQKFVFLEFLLT